MGLAPDTGGDIGRLFGSEAGLQEHSLTVLETSIPQAWPMAELGKPVLDPYPYLVISPKTLPESLDRGRHDWTIVHWEST